MTWLLVALVATGCAGMEPAGDPRRSDADVVVLDAMPPDATVLETIEYCNAVLGCSTGIIRPPMEDALRRAAELGADAFVVERRWEEGEYDCVRGKAVRIAPEPVVR